MGRANERGFSFSRAFPGFASIWVDFVDQNKSLELTIQRIERHRAYNEGRNDQAQIESTPATQPLPALFEPSAASQIAAIDPLQLIRSLVAESMQIFALSNQAAHAWQPQAAVASGIVAAAPAAGPIMSVARDLYLAPDVELARRTFVSITLNRKRTALAVIVEGGQERRQFYAFSARARFHTVWVKLRRTQYEHMFSVCPRTRTLLDAVGMSETRQWATSQV
jgi:hypothetical protein